MSKILYHVSTVDNRNSISNEGLHPKTVLDLNIERQPGIYMFASLEAAKEWAYWSALHYKQAMDIWKIALPQEYNLQKDTHPEMKEFNAWVGYDPISKNDLTVVKTQEVPNLKGE